MMLRSKYKAFLVWAILLGVSGLINLVWGPVEDFIARLSPISIWELPPQAWPAIGTTIGASVVAWVAAIFVGGALGAFSAIGHLAGNEDGKSWQVWFSVASGLRRGFNALYVVPLVLTISVAATILAKAELGGYLPPYVSGMLLIATSGVALAGQRVFVAVDDAITSAGADEMFLARSLFLGSSRGYEHVFPRMRRLFREARFLVNCRISLLGQAIEQAFHLAVVGVVILETVSGYLYEKFFPQPGAVNKWSGGIGRVIIDGQVATNPTLVAGAVWLVLLIDTFIASAIRAGLFRLWVEPYRSST